MLRDESGIGGIRVWFFGRAQKLTQALAQFLRIERFKEVALYPKSATLLQIVANCKHHHRARSQCLVGADLPQHLPTIKVRIYTSRSINEGGASRPSSMPLKPLTATITA